MDTGTDQCGTACTQTSFFFQNEWKHETWEVLGVSTNMEKLLDKFKICGKIT